MPCANVAAAKCRPGANQHRRDALSLLLGSVLASELRPLSPGVTKKGNRARKNQRIKRRVKDNRTAIEEGPGSVSPASQFLHLINLMTLH